MQKFIALTEVMPSNQALNLHTLLFQTCPLDNKQQWQSFRWTYDHEEKTLLLQHQLCQCTRQTPAHHECCLAVMLIVKHHHNIQHPRSFERLYKVQKYRREMNQENPQNQHNFGHFHLLICRNNSINTMYRQSTDERSKDEYRIHTLPTPGTSSPVDFGLGMTSFTKFPVPPNWPWK